MGRGGAELGGKGRGWEAQVKVRGQEGKMGPGKHVQLAGCEGGAPGHVRGGWGTSVGGRAHQVGARV